MAAGALASNNKHGVHIPVNGFVGMQIARCTNHIKRCNGLIVGSRHIPSASSLIGREFSPKVLSSCVFCVANFGVLCAKMFRTMAVGQLRGLVSVCFQQGNRLRLGLIYILKEIVPVEGKREIRLCPEYALSMTRSLNCNIAPPRRTCRTICHVPFVWLDSLEQIKNVLPMIDFSEW